MGVEVVYGSDTICRSNGSSGVTNYNFAIVVMCDAEGDATAPGVFISDIPAEDLDTCTPKVTVAHPVGCSEYSSRGFAKMNANFPWIIGMLMIFGGYFIGLSGVRFYKYTISTIGGIMFWQFLWAFMLLYKEPQTLFGRLVLGIFMSGTVFSILLTFPAVTTIFTGVVGGLFIGMFFSISLSAIANWNSFYMMAFIMGISATVSMGTSWKATKCPDTNDEPKKTPPTAD
jgi:hypothetical protein